MGNSTTPLAPLSKEEMVMEEKTFNNEDDHHLQQQKVQLEESQTKMATGTKEEENNDTTMHVEEKTMPVDDDEADNAGGGSPIEEAAVLDENDDDHDNKSEPQKIAPERTIKNTDMVVVVEETAAPPATAKRREDDDNGSSEDGEMVLDVKKAENVVGAGAGDNAENKIRKKNMMVVEKAEPSTITQQGKDGNDDDGSSSSEETIEKNKSGDTKEIPTPAAPIKNTTMVVETELTARHQGGEEEEEEEEEDDDDDDDDDDSSSDGEQMVLVTIAERRRPAIAAAVVTSADSEKESEKKKLAGSAIKKNITTGENVPTTEEGGEEDDNDDDSDASEVILAKNSKVSAAPAATAIKTRRYRSRKKKPKDYPKRPLSSYNVFFKESRLGLIKKHGQQGDETVDFLSMSKTIASQWKTLPEEKKLPYQKIATEDLARYEADVRAYEKKKAAEQDRIAGELDDQTRRRKQEAPEEKEIRRNKQAEEDDAEEAAAARTEREKWQGATNGVPRSSLSSFDNAPQEHRMYPESPCYMNGHLGASSGTTTGASSAEIAELCHLLEEEILRIEGVREVKLRQLAELHAGIIPSDLMIGWDEGFMNGTSSLLLPRAAGHGAAGGLGASMVDVEMEFLRRRQAEAEIELLRRRQEEASLLPSSAPGGLGGRGGGLGGRGSSALIDSRSHHQRLMQQELGLLGVVGGHAGAGALLERERLAYHDQLMALSSQAEQADHHHLLLARKQQQEEIEARMRRSIQVSKRDLSSSSLHEEKVEADRHREEMEYERQHRLREEELMLLARQEEELLLRRDHQEAELLREQVLRRQRGAEEHRRVMDYHWRQQQRREQYELEDRGAGRGVLTGEEDGDVSAPSSSARNPAFLSPHHYHQVSGRGGGVAVGHRGGQATTNPENDRKRHRGLLDEEEEDHHHHHHHHHRGGRGGGRIELGRPEDRAARDRLGYY